jgi:type I restriction enzyme R subunit
MSLRESTVEDAAMGWFQDLGYAVLPGTQLAPGEPAAERESFSDVVLLGRLREAIRRLNRAIPLRGPSYLCGTLLPKLLSGELSLS